jgi:hypothetical protein
LVSEGNKCENIWGYKFHGKKILGKSESVDAKMWGTASCYELIILAEDRRNVGTFVNTVMNLRVP